MPGYMIPEYRSEIDVFREILTTAIGVGEAFPESHGMRRVSTELLKVAALAMAHASTTEQLDHEGEKAAGFVSLETLKKAARRHTHAPS